MTKVSENGIELFRPLSECAAERQVRTERFQSGAFAKREREEYARHSLEPCNAISGNISRRYEFPRAVCRRRSRTPFSFIPLTAAVTFIPRTYHLLPVAAAEYPLAFHARVSHVRSRAIVEADRVRPFPIVKVKGRRESRARTSPGGNLFL